MLLAEAVIYLRRAIRRRFGTKITVRFLDTASVEFKQSPWYGQQPLPLILLDGKQISQGEFSYREVIDQIKLAITTP